MDTLNGMWENLVLDLISKQVPFVEEVTGARIVDKSRQGGENFRMEVWTKFNSQDSDAGKAIYAYLDETYVQKLPSGPGTKIMFKKHDH